MSIEFPREKMKTAEKIEKFRKINHCTIREFAKFIGTLGSSCTALKHGWVHMKDFERAEFLAIKTNNGKFDACMSFGDNLQTDLVWWKTNIKKAIRSIKQFKIEIEIFSDASRSA